MTQLEEARLQKEFIAEFQAFQKRDPQVEFKFGPRAAWYLLSAIQLVLRHPRFQAEPDAQTDWLREFAARLELFVSRGGPAMTKLAEMGWTPEHDR